MTTEEKAKAYDEALERAKDCLTDRKFSETEDTIRSVMEYIFPELAESENGRIREAIESIIRIYGKTKGEWIAGYDMDTLVVHLRDAFTYLEKQKVNTEGDFGRGYDCGYQAGYAVAMNEMKSKVATSTLDSEKQNKSDDEWVPKELIKYLKQKSDYRSCWIAWLEKHSEEEIKKIRNEEYTNGFNDATGFGKQKVLTTKTTTF